MWSLSYRIHSKYMQEAKYPLINFVSHIFKVILCAYFVLSMVFCKAMLDDFFCSAKKLHIPQLSLNWAPLNKKHKYQPVAYIYAS
jgi:hypothetical protein